MSEKKFEVYDLKVNQITEALGMDVEKPVFSWKLRAEKQNTMQKQAQILVGKTDGSAGVWDSGVMDTDESAGIAYAGEALEAETRYYVTVKVWDQDGEEAETNLFPVRNRTYEWCFCMGRCKVDWCSGIQRGI